MTYDLVFVEQWTEYSLGTAVFLLRIYSKLATVGWRKFQKDDMLIVLCIGLWTGVNVSVYTLNSNVSFSSAPDFLVMDDAQYRSFMQGTRAVMSSWMTYTTLIWSLKACWLFIFSRLTLGLRQQELVRIFAYITGLAYIVVIIMIMVHCIPSEVNWHVETSKNGSRQVIHGPYFVRWTVLNYIIVAAMNCSTDILLLSIPLPLIFFKLKASVGRKLVLGLLLCSGLFVIVAALLRCIESLGAIANIYNSTIWGIREVFVAICAVCAPGIKPLFYRNRESESVESGDGNIGKKISNSTSADEGDYTGPEKVGISMTRIVASHGTRDLIESPSNLVLDQSVGP